MQQVDRVDNVVLGIILFYIRVTKSTQIIEEIMGEASANAVSQSTEHIIFSVSAIVSAYCD